MKLTNQIKRLLCALIVLVMVFSLVPVDGFAASDVVDAAIFFSDLHSSKSDSKTSQTKNIMSSVANSGLHFSTVTSVGDVFSSNSTNNFGSLDTITSNIRTGLGDSDVNVFYTWSDHDRNTAIADYTGLLYGAGADSVYGNGDDDNYYIYAISMSDTSTNDRYNTGVFASSSELAQTLEKFTSDVAALDHSKPMFIASHQPLLDRRDDNGNAYKWAQVINAAAEEMDIIFLFGHNHKYDKAEDYYYAKGSSMPVCSSSSGSSVNVTLNFTHMCTGYMEPTSTGSYSSTTRKGTVVVAKILEDAIQVVTYDQNGVYTGSYAVNETVARDHAEAGTVPPVTEPVETEPVETEPVETEPVETEPVETEPEVPTTPVEPDIDSEWVEMPSANTYVLDTDGIDNGAVYLIVAKSYAKALKSAESSNNGVTVTLDGNTATADSDDYGWTFTASGDKYTIQNNGTYLGRSSSKVAAGSSSSTWTVTNNGSGNYNVKQTSSSSWWGGSNYNLRWSNSSSAFQASTSSSDPVRLYKHTDASGIGANYVRLTGETVQNYVIADRADVQSVLSKILLQTSADGETADTKTIAVTEDMVSWNTSFNGSAAGTYVGTVVCEGETLGTVTVTVIAEHNFETVTVAPTCTEDGSVTTKCTVCGEQTMEVVKALGHDYACVTTEATCGKDGSKVYTCGNCADTYTEVLPATGSHVYQTVTVEATCTEAGSVTHTCVCGDTYTEVIGALGHSYEAVVTAPTCTQSGCTTYTCATCGHSYTENPTEALGHNYTDKITATCTEDGFVVYTCSVCGHSYNGEAVKAYGHDYTATVVKPTCGKDGYTTYVCATCGHSYTDDIVTAPGHAYNALVTEATCTEGGFTTYTCTGCADSYVSDYTAALGHAYHSVVTEPTFEEMGYTTHTCSRCGDVVVDSYVPVKTHSYEVVTVEATCDTDGYTTYTCTECGYSYTETMAAFGHAFEITTRDPDCVHNGSIISTCTVCGHVETETIPALGHDFEVVTIDPNCETEGYTTWTCACGHIETETVAALGHKYKTVTTEPGCTEAGMITDTCSVCGKKVEEVIPALGHSYVTASTAPTCDTAGYTTYTCSVCGDSHTGDEVAALGHNYESAVTAPTCETAGYTTYTCTVCGHTYTGAEVAATGHSYETQESDGYLVYTCTVCGDTYSEKLNNTYSRVTAFASDNSYVITVKSGNKYYALSHADDKLTAVRVTVSNNEITSEVSEDLLWDYSNKKLSYVSDGTTYYLYSYSTGGWWGWGGTPTLAISTSDSSDVSISSTKLKVGSYYLRYSNSKITANSIAGSSYIFVEE